MCRARRLCQIAVPRTRCARILREEHHHLAAGELAEAIQGVAQGQPGGAAPRCQRRCCRRDSEYRRSRWLRIRVSPVSCWSNPDPPLLRRMAMRSPDTSSWRRKSSARCARLRCPPARGPGHRLPPRGCAGSHWAEDPAPEVAPSWPRRETAVCRRVSNQVNVRDLPARRRRLHDFKIPGGEICHRTPGGIERHGVYHHWSEAAAARRRVALAESHQATRSKAATCRFIPCQCSAGCC